MTKPEIILVEPMMPAIEARLDADYTVHRLFEPAGRDAALAARPRIRAVVTGGGSGIGSDWIEAMPALGIVAINGVGTDRVDLALARSRGVDVTTTPGTLTEDVADMGMALMLAVLRRIVEGDGFVRAGRWAAGEGFPLGGSLRGRRLGILGLGQIGQALARRAAVFGMDVRYWDRVAIPGVDLAAAPRSAYSRWRQRRAGDLRRRHFGDEGARRRRLLAALGPSGVVSTSPAAAW